MITVNDRTAKGLLPKRKKTKRNQTSDDPRIASARENVKKTYQAYHDDQSGSNEQILQTKKSELNFAYDTVLEEELNDDIATIEESANSQRHLIAGD